MKDSKEKDDIDTSTLEQFNLKELLINYRVFNEKLARDVRSVTLRSNENTKDINSFLLKKTQADELRRDLERQIWELSSRIEELEKPFYKKIMQWMKIKLFLKKN